MGLFVKHAVYFNSGFMAETASGILEGMLVAAETNTTTGEIQLAKADRAAAGHARGTVVGIAGDDATNVGNTIAIVDPVYQVVMSKPGRRIGDYYDTTITNVNNWTDPGTAKRGVTVFSYGGEFATDQYSATVISTGANTDGAGTPTFAINNTWTYGVTALAGQWVQDQTVANNIIARLTGSVSQGLLPIRLVPIDA